MKRRCSALILVLAGVIAVTCGCGSVGFDEGGSTVVTNHIKEVMDFAQKQGYSATQEESGVMIEADGVTYRFQVTESSVALNSIQTTLHREDAPTVKGEAQLEITVLNQDQVDLYIQDTVEEELANGKTLPVKERYGFTCGYDFSEESIDPNCASSKLGKASKYYYSITQWADQSILTSFLEKGLDLAATLEQGV